MNAIATTNGHSSNMDLTTIQDVILKGDLAKLTEVERLNYYSNVCNSLGFNPLTKPFEFITLNGKLVMYASRNCTEQLRSTRGVTVRIVSRERIDSVYIVTAQATLPDGRTDESTGVVNLTGTNGQTLQGEALANAMMKAETKAKRRVTLSICGLSFMDESEDGSWREETNRAPRNEPVKDFTQFASEEQLKALEEMVRGAEAEGLMNAAELEYYAHRIDLTRRGVAREQKGNRAPVFAYSPLNINRDAAQLDKDVAERRGDKVQQQEVQEAVEVDQTADEFEELRETMEAMKDDERFAKLPANLQNRFSELLVSMQAGEEVSEETVRTAIEFVAAKYQEMEAAKPAVKTAEKVADNKAATAPTKDAVAPSGGATASDPDELRW